MREENMAWREQVPEANGATGRWNQDRASLAYNIAAAVTKCAVLFIPLDKAIEVGAPQSI
jgi:hypothetical protein